MLKIRNSLLAIGVALVAASFGAAYAMEWWKTPTDYWLAWAAMFTGLGAVICLFATTIVHCVLAETAGYK